MKKLVIIVMLLSSILIAKAQGTLVLHIDQDITGEEISVCLNLFNRVELYAQDGCTNFFWGLDGNYINDNPLVLVHGNEDYFEVGYSGCDLIVPYFPIVFVEPSTLPIPITQKHWKLPNETITLYAVGPDSLNMYNYQWSTGETTPIIQVPVKGDYQCEIRDRKGCGSITRNFPVYDMAELSVANTDPVTGQIYLQWDLEESVAQNATTLEIYRGNDTVNPIGTANYVDMYWNDPDANNSAARTYWIRTIAYDGSESPAVGPIQTIYMAYNLSYFEDYLNLNWNIPQGYDLEWFIMNQLVYNRDGEPEIIAFDSVTPDVNMFTCPISKLDNNGKVFVEGRVREGKRAKISPFSNPTVEEIVGIEEKNSTSFDIFPNPAKGHFTVRCQGKIKITNILSQEVLSQEVDGQKTFNLPPGEYIVTYNKQSRKLVVQ